MAVVRNSPVATNILKGIPAHLRLTHFNRLREVIHGAAIDAGKAIDNDLIALNWVSIRSCDGRFAGIEITPLGRSALAEYASIRRAAKRPHEDLADLVLAHYADRYICFKAPNILGSYPDVFLIKPTRQPARWQPTAIEVKANISDARRDISAGKWRKYATYAERVYFAAPTAVIRKLDVPEDVGILVIENGFVSCMRIARRNRAANFSAEAAMGLIFHQAARTRESLLHRSIGMSS